MISKRMLKMVSSGSMIRAMFEEGRKLSNEFGEENVFDFSLGNPSIKTPNLVKNSIIGILNSSSEKQVHGYMSNSGYLSVRQKVSNDLNKRFNTTFGADNIIMTVGAAGGLNCILQTLLNPGDEVIVVAPFFTEYRNYIDNWQGKMVLVSSAPPFFRLPIKQINEAINSKTKAIMINNPNNPTGVVYTEKEIKELSQILRGSQKRTGNPIYIISDEPYREIVYEDNCVPFIPKYYENTIVVYSWSKSLSLPGERIGYLAVSPNATDCSSIISAATISNRIIGFVNAPSLIQLTIAECLGEQILIDEYESNRKLLCSELNKIGFEFVYPQGAFYLWMKSPCDELKFVEKAKKHNLLFVPGSAFGCKGYIRLAYCVNREMIKRSIPAFKKLKRDIFNDKE